MKQTLVIFLVLLITTTSTAQQSTISGIVAIHNSEFDTGKRKYVNNAQIEDDFEKANAQVTDANGIFKLIFVGVPEKTTISLLVKKEGLEVVNIDVLNAVTGQKEQVKISMAKPNQIAEYRKQIYKIGKTAAEKNLDAKNQALLAERTQLKLNESVNRERISALETQLVQISEQRQRIEADSKELARRYAPINLDDAIPLYQEAFTFFQKGDLDQALKILQNANYIEQVEKVLRERDKIVEVGKELAQRDAVQQQRTKEIIQGLSFKADLHKTLLEFDSTSLCYELMLQLDSSDNSILQQYAYFLANQNNFDKAIFYFQKALLAAKTDDTKAKIFNNLGNTYRAGDNMDEAVNAYTEALQLFRKLAVKNPAEFKPFVALILNNLGNFYRNNHNLEEATQSITEALNIYQALSQNKNKETFQPYIALTYNNLGRVYYEGKNMLKAKNAFEEALEIYEDLARKNPDAILPGDMQVFIDLSLTYSDNDKRSYLADRYSEALLNRALIIHRQLSLKNPDVFLPFVALTLNNLGRIYSNQHNFSKADAAYQEALKIHRDFADKNPKAYFPFVAFTLKNLGAFYQKFDKPDLANAAISEAEKMEQAYGKNK